MSLWKKNATTHFLSKLIHNFYLERKCTASVIFKNLPKENYRPIGENSPNLVTLLVASFQNV
jgi:hypothetical protein